MKRIILFASFLLIFVFYKSQFNLYYQSIDLNLSGDPLKVQLSNLISNTHQNLIPYTSTSTIDTWDVIKTSDTYLSDTSKVMLIYGYNDTDADIENDLTRDKSLSCHSSPCDGLWNREHVYPKSIASPNLVTNFPGPGTDVHNLRSCDYATNTSRGNLIFTSGSGNAGNVNNIWFPGEEWKGDVARIIMYMYLRYPNQCHAINVGSGGAQYAPNSDMPDIFLEWNTNDPVSLFEENRNESIYNVQGNRNPFIDNPYLATLIWNGPPAENKWLGVGSLTNRSLINDLISIYPNPIKTHFEVSNSDYSISKIILYSSLGKELIRCSGNHMNIEQIPTGIYFVQIFDAGGKLNCIKKVIKH